jgi:DNA-binding NtrC family response regulator
MADAIRVLLVDDEPVFVDTMSKVLKARGYGVGAAAGGVEALEELRFNRYDVVVLDLRMPGMDGIETLERIRKQDPLLPVILLSGHADMSKAVEAMEHGAVDYMLKPAPVDKLCERIRSAVEHRNILKEITRTAGE